MMNFVKRWFGLVIFICLSVAISSCKKPKEVEKEVIITPVEEKVVIPPVKEKDVSLPVEEKAIRPPMEEKVVTSPVEEKTIKPVDWMNRYGPDGEDKIITIGELYVVKWTDNAGTSRSAVMTWDEAINWTDKLDWLEKTDWRLPTDVELKKIYQSAELLGAYEAGEYWTSSLHPRVPDRSAVTVNCGIGKARYRDKSGEFFVRAVRLID